MKTRFARSLTRASGIAVLVLISFASTLLAQNTPESREFLYVANGMGTVSRYLITPEGALVQVGSAQELVPGGKERAARLALTAKPGGRFVYAGKQDTNEISGYVIEL